MEQQQNSSTRSSSNSTGRLKSCQAGVCCVGVGAHGVGEEQQHGALRTCFRVFESVWTHSVVLIGTTAARMRTLVLRMSQHVQQRLRARRRANPTLPTQCACPCYCFHSTAPSGFKNFYPKGSKGSGSSTKRAADKAAGEYIYIRLCMRVCSPRMCCVCCECRPHSINTGTLFHTLFPLCCSVCSFLTTPPSPPRRQRRRQQQWRWRLRGWQQQWQQRPHQPQQQPDAGAHTHGSLPHVPGTYVLSICVLLLFVFTLCLNY